MKEELDKIEAKIDKLDEKLDSVDTHLAWSGTQFTAPITGMYSVDGVCCFTATHNSVITAYINDTQPSIIRTLCPNDITTRFNKLSAQIPLVKGDKLSFRLVYLTRTHSSAGGDTPYHYISIVKIG